MRRRPSVDTLRSGGEVAVSVSGRVMCLTPLSALLVNLSEDWVALPALVELAVDVVDPDRELPDSEQQVRTALLALVSQGVLDLSDDAPA